MKSIFLTLLTSILLTAGCNIDVDAPGYYYVGGLDAGASKELETEFVCPEFKYYESDIRLTSTYTSPDFKPFTITVDVDFFKNYDVTAKLVAELAYYMTEVHKSMDLPNPKETYEALTPGHFIVVEDNSEFSYLFGTEDTCQIGAFVVLPIAAACWDVPEGVKWTSVIRAQNWKRYTVAVIVHEMTHVLSQASYGDPDSNHENKLLWLRFGEDTLMNQVIVQYENTYGVDDIFNNFSE